MHIPWLPSELAASDGCLDSCNAAHLNSFGRVWCGAMSHGNGICLINGEDLAEKASRSVQGEIISGNDDSRGGSEQ